MAFCTNCGTQLPDGAVFCPGCGAKNAPAPEAPIYAEPVRFEETQVLDAQEPVYAPVYEEPAPTYQPPVYTPPVYDQPQQAPVYEQPAPTYQPQQAPVYEQPAPTYQPPVYGYQPPVVNAQPEISAGTKVKGFIGMGLGIFGFVMGILSLIIALASLGLSTFGASAMVYSLLGLGGGIAAKILSGKSASEGFSGAPIKLGSIFGLIAIILSGIAFFFGLIGSVG